MATAHLVNCPTKWSLSLLFGFLWWSSSWRWQPHIGWCRLLWPLPRAGMAFLTHFFCKMYFLYVSWGHKTFLTGFWGVLPCQKGPKFQASTLNELVCQNWGAPLNFGKLLSTSTDTFQAYSPQWSGFPKLRGAPQFWETALQCTITDIASTTSKNDCFQMSFKLHDFRLPCFFCFFFVKFDCESKYRYNYLWFKTSVLDFLTFFLSSGPTSGWSWQKKKFDNPVAILWENWVASIGSIWRGFGWDSSQTEVLQSPWISKKWPKHLLIFPSAQYNHIVGGMMKKREAQKIEKFEFEILWFRRRARKLNKFYPRLTFLYF